MKAKEGHSGLVFGLLAAMLCIMVSLAWTVDPECDRLQRQSPGKDWLTNGGDLTNQRYSTLKQIGRIRSRSVSITSNPVWAGPHPHQGGDDSNLDQQR